MYLVQIYHATNACWTDYFCSKNKDFARGFVRGSNRMLTATKYKDGDRKLRLIEILEGDITTDINEELV